MKAFLAFVLLAAGCGQEDIRVYTVSKDSPTPPSAPQLKWTLPDGWIEGAPSEFRVASFRIKSDGKEADLSVVPLPGDAGGDLSNVNRWRGQVELPPISEDELKRQAESAEVAGQPATLYDLAGESKRILAAIQHRDGTAWFFKMTGDAALVAQQKPVFVRFLSSVQFATADDERRWPVPVGWQEVPGGQFLVAKFAIAGGASVNVSSSAGNGGGLAANVNRWRKQLGLDEMAGDQIAKSVTTSGEVTLVTLTGANASLVGAIVTRPGQIWFYKLMGDAKVVAAQKDAFIKFVNEVKY